VVDERAQYAFGEYELDVGRFELRRHGAAVHVEPKVFDVLAYLVRNRARVVPKSELLDAIWGDRFVSESALTTRLKAARRAVGDDGGAQSVIRTVHGRGYQFVSPVSEAPPEPAATVAPSGPAPAPRSAEPPRGNQQIRYCRARDGVRIAYATCGQGPPLVKAANWMTHIDLEWDNAVWGHWLAGLSRHHTLVRYDERGCGLSDWEVDRFDFEAWVDDLSVVVDAAGLDRFPLLGVSQGGAVAVAFAVRHPERVSRLVLVGAYSRGRMVRAETREEKEEAALDIDLARVAWRRGDDSFRQVFAAQFLPDGTAEQQAAFNELQRCTTSAENAGRFLDEFAHIDVSGLVPQVRCPTLVVQSRGDLRTPPAQARELAAAIPGSRLVLLNSRNHLLTDDEPAWPDFLAELDAFLAEE
jgi:pimeloyl-ACP methyl ester carboxylesterase/DNA-binding winged helix-turn-helix (wHTH) protein